ncbi:hypothetical protein CBR_g49728 [Chara braunii]|uniref:Uncharacterized protein n=1 Tax=Chara braunii TaxID=69332 RepID=A0A388M5R1_CHABU|nr:hypothetical protein CBR_g49728 [Chara braunii]|eukprot:GBG89880.1 hypothetical protein CBR_g49728 [Chara braunii]
MAVSVSIVEVTAILRVNALRIVVPLLLLAVLLQVGPLCQPDIGRHGVILGRRPRRRSSSANLFRREEQVKKREFEEKRKIDELIRQEIERNSEALEARVMAKIGRQFLMARENVRREEVKCSRTLVQNVRDTGLGDYGDKVWRRLRMKSQNSMSCVKGSARTLAADKVFFEGFRIVDDVTVFAAVSSSCDEHKVGHLLSQLTRCYGSNIRLVRTDSSQEAWIFAGVQIHRVGLLFIFVEEG